MLTDEDRNLISLLKTQFSSKFERWKIRRNQPKKKQFAILLYRPDMFNTMQQDTDIDKVFLEDIRQGFSHPYYCAAVPRPRTKPRLGPSDDKLCSERIILPSLMRSVDLHEVMNDDAQNIYLYTYYEPCPDCADIILDFVDTHRDGFNLLIVGCTELYLDPQKKGITKSKFDECDKIVLIQI